MAGCLDNARCESCTEWFAEPARRNRIFSATAGTLFATGWWIIVDVLIAYPTAQFHWGYIFIGVAASLALLLINLISNERLRGESISYSDGCLGVAGARVIFFVGFIIAFGALIASLWICIATYIIEGQSSVWPGIALFLQNLLIFLSAVIFKFGRTEETS